MIVLIGTLRLVLVVLLRLVTCLSAIHVCPLGLSATHLRPLCLSAIHLGPLGLSAAHLGPDSQPEPDQAAINTWHTNMK